MFCGEGEDERLGSLKTGISWQFEYLYELFNEGSVPFSYIISA
jgi:hypothetical protein